MNFKTSNASPTTLAAALLIAASTLLAGCGPFVSSANAQTESTVVVTARADGASDNDIVIQATLGVDLVPRQALR